MKKDRSPRENLPSVRWAYKVYELAGISSPDKNTSKKLNSLWKKGYSFKDAATLMGGE